jgi:hypothetical protein
MAWTKGKMAVVVGAAVVVAIVAIRAFHTARAEPPDIQGAWEGTDFGTRGYKGRPIKRSRVVLKLLKTNGVYASAWDYIDLERKDAWRNVIRKVTYDFPNLRFDEEPWGIRKATINADGTIMTIGSGPNVTILERTKSPDTVPDWLTESEFTPRDGSALQGCWTDGSPDFPLVWRITDPVDGNRRAELDAPGIGASHWAAEVISKPPTTILKLLNGCGAFKCKPNEAGTEIVGSFGGTNMITFKRTNHPPGQPLPEGDYSFVSPADLQGHWKASLPMKMDELAHQPRNLDIARLPGGTYSAAFASPLSIGTDDPIGATDFRHDLSNVRVEWKAQKVLFEGKLADGKLTGKWSEDGESYRLSFERSR